KDAKCSISFAWWARLISYIAALVVPPAGLTASLWLHVITGSRARLKFARGLLLVSLTSALFYLGMYLDPTSRVTDCANSIFRPSVDHLKGGTKAGKAGLGGKKWGNRG